MSKVDSILTGIPSVENNWYYGKTYIVAHFGAEHLLHFKKLIVYKLVSFPNPSVTFWLLVSTVLCERSFSTC